MKTSMQIEKGIRIKQHPVFNDGDIFISKYPDGSIYICTCFSDHTTDRCSAIRIAQVSDGTIRADSCMVIKDNVDYFHGKIILEVE